MQDRLTEAIARAERPVPAQQLVGGEQQRFFLIIQIFAQSGWNGIVEHVGDNN